MDGFVEMVDLWYGMLWFSYVDACMVWGGMVWSLTMEEVWDGFVDRGLRSGMVTLMLVCDGMP